jgi:hypothetical protein
MIDYSKTAKGDKLKIVGDGAPGFAPNGAIITVTQVQSDRVDVVTDDGRSAYFAFECGAARLEAVKSSGG